MESVDEIPKWDYEMQFYIEQNVPVVSFIVLNNVVQALCLWSKILSAIEC